MKDFVLSRVLFFISYCPYLNHRNPSIVYVTVICVSDRNCGAKPVIGLLVAKRHILI